MAHELEKLRFKTVESIESDDSEDEASVIIEHERSKHVKRLIDSDEDRLAYRHFEKNKRRNP